MPRPSARRTSATATETGAGPAPAPPERSAPPDPLGPLTALPGVGPARAAKLERAGLRGLRDLLFLAPRRIAVWPATIPVAEARRDIGEEVRIEGRVRDARLTRLGGRRSLVRAVIADDSGSIEALFYNQPWKRDELTVGSVRELCGRVLARKGEGPALAGPRMGDAERPLPQPGTLEPRYSAPEGWSSEALAGACAWAAEHCAARLSEPLPAAALARLGLPSLPRAARDAHRPPSLEAFEAARRRLALEPLLAAQARLAARRAAHARGRARPARVSDALHAEILAHLPFELTAGQRRVALELRGDLARTVPMYRLLQGEVGAGKTVLAFYASVAVVESDGQVAFMAPTELLAEQHFYGLRDRLLSAGVESALLTGSVPRDERRWLLERLARGEVQVLFGTHALFSADVRFRRLDLVVIDEQHRFGVDQRARLADKGDDVHLLLMTATPIPRTLALTVYGDLDVSTLRELPPGRGALGTRWVRGAERRKLSGYLHERLEAGEQVYWVCPRIGADDSAAGGTRLASAEKRHEQVLASRLAPFGVELVHGRIAAEERAYRLDRFRRGEIGMLVATTVIEVGVDVPAATVMVIENAERLGLAQLHQLRGRVGRGPRDAWCLLLGDAKAQERLRLLERTRDGFVLAEEDLRQRGMGDLMGLRQSGANAEGLVDPEADVDLVLAARDLVREDEALCARYLEMGDARPITP